MNNKEKVYQVTSQIPKGKVLTYGMLAKLAGVKNPRIVGTILHKNIDPIRIPCHRIVNAMGKVSAHYAFGGARAQTKKLQSEGVVVFSGRVDLTRFLWNG